MRERRPAFLRLDHLYEASQVWADHALRMDNIDGDWQLAHL